MARRSERSKPRRLKSSQTSQRPTVGSTYSHRAIDFFSLEWQGVERLSLPTPLCNLLRPRPPLSVHISVHTAGWSERMALVSPAITPSEYSRAADQRKAVVDGRWEFANVALADRGFARSGSSSLQPWPPNVLSPVLKKVMALLIPMPKGTAGSVFWYAFGVDCSECLPSSL